MVFRKLRGNEKTLLQGRDCLHVCSLSAHREVLETEIVCALKRLQVCRHVCVCPCTPYDPAGQKSRRMRVYNNKNPVGSPEQCVNMDTMEMHHAIMAGFMHFSLAG